LLKESPDALIIGMDEAGCGPWAGPLVAGAVAFSLDQWDMIEKTLSLNDSKKLTPKKRDALFPKIQDYGMTGVGIASVQDIDTLGLAAAHRLALARAMEMLLSKNSVFNPIIFMDGVRSPKLPYPTHMMVKGDSKSCSIAAASILAKVTRDRLMKVLADDYPDYGFEKNAGYGTKAHREALHEYGVTVHHRQSYAPIRAFLDDKSAHIHLS
jgi:ribonuclease HII